MCRFRVVGPHVRPLGFFRERLLAFLDPPLGVVPRGRGLHFLDRVVGVVLPGARPLAGEPLRVREGLGFSSNIRFLLGEFFLLLLELFLGRRDVVTAGARKRVFFIISMNLV